MLCLQLSGARGVDYGGVGALLLITFLFLNNNIIIIVNNVIIVVNAKAII